MAYKRRIQRGKYNNGPYYYKSIRDKLTGKVRSIYLGKNPINFSAEYDDFQDTLQRRQAERAADIIKKELKHEFISQEEAQAKYDNLKTKGDVELEQIKDDLNARVRELRGLEGAVEKTKKKSTQRRLKEKQEDREQYVEEKAEELESKRESWKESKEQGIQNLPYEERKARYLELNKKLDNQQYYFNKGFRAPEFRTQNLDKFEQGYRDYVEKDLLYETIKKDLEKLPEEERRAEQEVIPGNLWMPKGLKQHLQQTDILVIKTDPKVKVIDEDIGSRQKKVDKIRERARIQHEQIKEDREKTKQQAKQTTTEQINKLFGDILGDDFEASVGSVRRPGAKIGKPSRGKSINRRSRTLSTRTRRLFKQSEKKKVPKISLKLVGKREYKRLIKQRVPEEQLEEAEISNAFYDRQRNQAFILDEGTEVSRQKAALEETYHADGHGEDTAESEAISAMKEDGVPEDIAESVRGRDKKGEPLAFNKTSKKAKAAVDTVIDAVEDVVT